MDCAPGPLPARAATTDRAAEDGFWHPARQLAQRPAARLGGTPDLGKAAQRKRIAGCEARPPPLAGTPVGPAQLAIPAVGRADVRGVARALGVISSPDRSSSPPKSTSARFG